jgi:hypothetical protein
MAPLLANRTISTQLGSLMAVRPLSSPFLGVFVSLVEESFLIDRIRRLKADQSNVKSLQGFRL